jgi:aryl-alcohol dehydrogenase-like predicted oxidoreductase
MSSIRATRDYSKRFPDLKYKLLGKTGFAVSTCGFGCYRIDISVEDHYKALEYAIINGINLIDTSSNYANGGSEELIGKVISRGKKEGKLFREEIVLVTKGGYIQGENHELVSHKEISNNPYPEVVKCTPDLWHCIHPEFISDQITLSTKRLKTDKIDIYLLHNPEYFLKYSGIHDNEERETEYYNRIRKAFDYLEQEVENGRIQYYGVSSNTFVEKSGSKTFSSLEKMVEIAEDISDYNHFAVIQLPFNLYERGGFLIKNNRRGNMSVLEYAASKNLGVLINRPLNALVKNRIYRLSDYSVSEGKNRDEIKALVERISVVEGDLINYISEIDIGISEKRHIIQCLTVAKEMRGDVDKFQDPSQFDEIKSYYVIPRANYAISKLLNTHTSEDWLIDKLKEYIRMVNILMISVKSELAKRQNKKNELLHEQLNKYLPENEQQLTLSQKVFLINNSLPSVSSTLVGMRKINYVNNVLEALRRENINNAEEIIRNIDLPEQEFIY